VRCLSGLVFAASLLGAALDARAAGNDFRLNARKPNANTGLLFSETAGRFVARPDQWQELITELGFVVAPRLASPAETLGHAGFHLGVLWSGSFVSNDQEFWFVTEEAQRSGNPNGVLQTLQVDVRKGLPLSFEVGANLTWLVDSELWAPGLEVRWAVHEGFHMAPDIGIRGSVSHLVGHRDVNLTVIGIDAVISRSFGVAGMVNVAPYFSFSLLMMAASSRVIDPTPTDETDVGANIVLPELSATGNMHQKMTLGTRLLFSVFNLTVQGEFQFLEDTPTGRKVFGPVATITTKLGLDY
jgi:hypothetical protein